MKNAEELLECQFYLTIHHFYEPGMIDFYQRFQYVKINRNCLVHSLLVLSLSPNDSHQGLKPLLPA